MYMLLMAFNLLLLLLTMLGLIVFFSSLYKFLFTLFGRWRLQINQDKIELSGILWGTRIKFARSADKNDICLLQRIRKYAYKSFDMSSFPVQAQIIIWAGKKKKFIIGNDSDLISEPELDWLAEELSEWLNMPISTE